MTQVHWLRQISGAFTNASDWSSGVAPGSSDDAILDAAGVTPYTVTASTSETVNSIQTEKSATLQISAGVFAATAASGAGSNAGTITVADGATLLVGGTLDNTGVLDFQGTSKGAALEVAPRGLTLTGGGQIVLADSLSAPFQPCPPKYSLDPVFGVAGATLTNVDNTIAGAGFIGVGRLTLVNKAQGVIDASLVTALVVQTAGASVNRGLLEATGAGGLYIVYSTLDNSAGGVIAAAGANVYLSFSTIIGGTLTSSGPGFIYNDHGPVILDGSTAGALTIKALVFVSHDSPVTIKGAIDNQGEIEVGAATLPSRLIVGTSGATLTGHGKIVLKSTNPNTGITGATAGAMLTNVDNTISGLGQIGAGRLTLINQSAGIIDARYSIGLVLNTGANAVVNNGLIEATGHGGLTIRSTSIDGSGGGVILAGNGSHVGLQGADLIGGTLRSMGTGQIKTYLGGPNLLDGTTSSVNNQAKVVVQNGTALTIQGAIVNSGRVQLSASSADAILTIAVAGASLSGGGHVLLSDSSGNTIVGASSAATLTNVDNVITGAGRLGAGSLTLINQAAGVIVGSLSAALIIDTGANAIVNAGVIAARSAGGVTIDSAVANSGVLEADGGALTVNGAVSGAGEGVIAAGTLDFASSFSQKVVFRGASGVLELARSQSYAGTVFGFSKTGGTALDLRDIGFVKSTEATFSGTASGGVLTVTDGTHTAHITLTGDYLASTFTAASDGQGGTIVVDRAAPAAAAHRFIAAAAGLGARGGGPVSLAHDVWRAHPAMLGRPRMAVA